MLWKNKEVKSLILEKFSKQLVCFPWKKKSRDVIMYKIITSTENKKNTIIEIR